MITVRTQDKLYRFPDDTPQEVMKGAIDKHIQLLNVPVTDEFPLRNYQIQVLNKKAR